MTTSNPAFKNPLYDAAAGSGVMTANGVTAKTGILTALMLYSGYCVWSASGTNPNILAYGFFALLAALVLGFITIMFPRSSSFLAPLYAIAEGLGLGAISALYNAKYHGLPFEALALTGLTLVAMLVVYRTGLIKVTPRFVTGLFMATGAICLYYFLSIILSLFHVSTPGLSSYGPLGLGISFLITCVAALNLLLDFKNVEDGIAQGAPKYMEWYAAFGLMVTLAWLYLEILRLLANLKNSD